MSKSEVHVCECPHCQQESAHADQELHRQMNLLVSRLDEQQRRRYVAVESKRVGRGGDRLLKSLDWTKRRSNADGKNWQTLWPPGQANGFAYQEVGDPRRKKRCRARVSSLAVDQTRNCGRSHERTEVGTQQFRPCMPTSGQLGASHQSSHPCSLAPPMGLLPPSQCQETRSQQRSPRSQHAI